MLGLRKARLQTGGRLGWIAVMLMVSACGSSEASNSEQDPNDDSGTPKTLGEGPAGDPSLTDPAKVQPSADDPGKALTTDPSQASSPEGSQPNCELPTNEWVAISSDGIDWPMRNGVTVSAQGAWADGMLWVQIGPDALWQFDPCENTWTQLSPADGPSDLQWQATAPLIQPSPYRFEIDNENLTTTVIAQAGTERFDFEWGSHIQSSGQAPNFEASMDLIEGGQIMDRQADSAWKAISNVGSPTARYYPLLAFMGERILVTGGFTQWDPTINGTGMVPESATGESAIYDPASDSWTQIADAPTIQNPRLPSSLTHPVRLWQDGRLLIFEYDGGAIYTEATDSWVATETTLGVAAPGYFISGDRYVDFGQGPRVLDLNSGEWTALPSDASALSVDPNQNYGWSVQVWSGKTFFRWGVNIEPVCTDALGAECQQGQNIAGGAMYTIGD